MKKKVLNQLIASVLVCGSILAAGIAPANAEVKSQTGMVTEDGKTYLYNGLGQKETGWVNISNKWYYFNENGEMQKNTTLKINDKNFKFDENGIALNENGTQVSDNVTDKAEEDLNKYGAHIKIKNGKIYYCNASDQETGWVCDVDGKMYYYNEKGEMQKNTTVKDLTGKEVKLNEKGVVVGEHGYDLIDGEEVTYDSSEAYKESHKQWKKVGNDWYYYFGDQGIKIVDSWQKDNGLFYYFNKEGKMQKSTTVKSEKGNDCILNADGALINKSTPDITFDDDNYEWKQVDGNWYYMNSDGDKEKGWIQDNGKWYYCNKDGIMQKNTTIIDQDIKYVLGTDGAWIK
ncbi:cell wall binding repeat-containing protein [Clostridium sp. DL-VIII]|uniref:N-acetylmuramoyl-L-alanine amidase family protein n=1 Tax=Clostridium sp. DL-VIII TaxID=641107 RepID=UPI00023B066C|nr:cell wall-binding protein [Clostridium sp. DL-VIII]EHJ02072.1 cell wall binding repeat-containing protein [Clostridium sp. DL-VIII]